MQTLSLILCVVLFWGIPLSGNAQMKLSWDDLYDVTFEEGDSSGYLKPVFGPEISQFDGEEVYLSGYMIPIDFQANTYVLSAYPNANCFFCGGAGPESVMELQLKNAKRNYRTDEWRRFKGKLCLNRGNNAHLHYILEKAEVY